MHASYIYEYKINLLKEQGHENKEDLSTEKTIKADNQIDGDSILFASNSLSLEII